VLIIDKYIIREIGKPLLAGCIILIAIFVGARAADYLADAAEGLILVSTVVQLISLRILTALELLVPIALYLSVVAGLGRLYADSEITALQGSGISETRLLNSVLKLSLLCALLVGCLSIYVRPWAYQKTYQLQAQAEAVFTLSKLEAERFYESPQAERTIFFEDINRGRQLLKGIFLRNQSDNNTQLIYAQAAYPLANSEDDPVLVLLKGHLYTLDRNGSQDLTVSFQEMKLRLADQNGEMLGYKRKAVATSVLATSDNLEDIGEFQWRVSRPLSTLLLGLLGVPLSRATPRQGKFAKGLMAILIYAVYYNASAMAKTWLDRGVVEPIPGLWWSEALLAVFLIMLLLWPRFTFRRRGN
jgi:lipopolysaccharide export system permease protein